MVNLPVPSLISEHPDSFTGNTTDLSSVAAALEGVYGVFVNTDSDTLGEQLETYTGIRIFELATTVKTIRHYVWSSLDYIWRVRVVRPPQSAMLRS